MGLGEVARLPAWLTTLGADRDVKTDITDAGGKKSTQKEMVTFDPCYLGKEALLKVIYLYYI